MITPFKFGASTWLWTSPFRTALAEELFAKISGLGFQAVEIAVEDPALIDPVKLRQIAEQFNLDIIVCGAFGPGRDLTHADEAVHEQCFDYIRTCLDFCVEMKSAFFAGPLYSAVGKARMIPADQRKKEWELAVKNVRKACELAAERGIEIAIEPLNRFESDMINTAADAFQFIQDINHPAAKIMLDSFHMNIEERNVVEAITMVAPKLVHFQVSENYRGIPGTGTTPWNQYSETLRKINYQGTISIESFTPQNKELAGAVWIWKPFAENQDDFAAEGLAFLKSWNNSPSGQGSGL